MFCAELLRKGWFMRTLHLAVLLTGQSGRVTHQTRIRTLSAYNHPETFLTLFRWEPVESFNTKKTLRIFWKNADTKGRDWDDSTQWRVGDEVYLRVFLCYHSLKMMYF